MRHPVAVVPYFRVDVRRRCGWAGYSVEGTLARDLLSKPKEVTSSTGRKLRLNAVVSYITFAGSSQTVRASVRACVHHHGNGCVSLQHTRIQRRLRALSKH
jgi:hypothetical protein